MFDVDVLQPTCQSHLRVKVLLEVQLLLQRLDAVLSVHPPQHLVLQLLPGVLQTGVELNTNHITSAFIFDSANINARITASKCLPCLSYRSHPLSLSVPKYVNSGVGRKVWCDRVTKTNRGFIFNDHSLDCKQEKIPVDLFKMPQIFTPAWVLLAS